MKLTGSVSYAIGILLQVAASEVESPMTAAKIARGCRFPPRFLYRILRRLVDAGLMEGTSGPGGGYRLAKPPASLTLFDVVAAVDAPPEPSRLRPVKASHQKPLDRVNRLCAVSAARFTRDLRGMKLSSLIQTLSAKPKPGKSKSAGPKAPGPKSAGAKKKKRRAAKRGA